MPKNTSYSCAKSVNNYRINSSKSSALLSTELIIILLTWNQPVINHYVFNQIATRVSTTVSTWQNQLFNLLNKSFTHYPQHLLLEPRKGN